MQPPIPTKPKKINYLTNASLREQVLLSKHSFSSYIEDEHARFDQIVDSQHIDVAETLASVDLPIGGIVRVYTWDHIPLDNERIIKPREKNKTHAKLTFLPYQHFMLTPHGWQLVGKSHWKGGMENGHYSPHHGRITNKLATALMLLVERIGKKGNWAGYSYRDEMQGLALVQLCQVALQFDESKSDNVFAYFTTITNNCFIRVLNEEKKRQNLRDDLLISYGQPPSMTRQVEHELAQAGYVEPPALVRKRGRPKTIKEAPTVTKTVSLTPNGKRVGRPPKARNA